MEQKNVDDVENADFTNETIIDDEYKEIEKEEKKSSNRWVSIVISLFLLIYSVYEYNVAYEKEYDRQMEIYNAEQELLNHISSAFQDSNYEYEEEEEEPFALTGPQVYVLEESNQIYDSLKLGMTKNEVIALMGEPDKGNSTDRTTDLFWYSEFGVKCGVVIKNNRVNSFTFSYIDYISDFEAKEGMTTDEIISLLGTADSYETTNGVTWLYWKDKLGTKFARIDNGIVSGVDYDWETVDFPNAEVKIGMTKEQVIKIMGEPEEIKNNPQESWCEWNEENDILYSVSFEEGIVDSVYRELYSSSENNIQLSTEIGTEIEDLETLAKDLKDGMELSEVTAILGEKYIEKDKGENSYYNSCIWYDKLEKYIEINFVRSGDSRVTALVNGVDDVKSSY